MGMTIEEICQEMGLGAGCGSCLEYANSVVEDPGALPIRDCSAA